MILYEISDNRLQSLNTYFAILESCTDIRDGRKSLMNKRRSLLSQCQITPSSPAPRHFRKSLYMNVTHTFSPEITKRLSG